MGHLPASLLAAIFVILTYCILFTGVASADRTSDNTRKVQSLPQLMSGKDAYKRYLRSSVGDGQAPQKVLQLSRSKIPIELDLLLDDDESFDKSKRYDDYGHMRFGKRNGGGEDQFDDYGHMRFGKRGELF